MEESIDLTKYNLVSKEIIDDIEYDTILSYDRSSKYMSSKKYHKFIGKILNNKIFEGKKYSSNKDGKIYGLIYEGNFKKQELYTNFWDKKNSWILGDTPILYDGIGKEYHNNKLKYEGEFKDGKYCGNGIKYNDNLKLYEGEFNNGNYHGKGKLYNHNGKIEYEGPFIFGKRSGFGTDYYYFGVDKVEISTGNWYNDERNGVKIINGKIDGIYLNGKDIWEDDYSEQQKIKNKSLEEIIGIFAEKACDYKEKLDLIKEKINDDN